MALAAMARHFPVPLLADRFPYRLSLARALIPFAPEIDYVCAFLERCYPLVRDEAASRILHYGPDAPFGAVAVPAAVFPDAVSVARDGLHLNRGAYENQTAGRGNATLLPNRADPDGPCYDAIGLIFLMLSKLEERTGRPLDRYGRFPHTASLAHQLGRPGAPLADIAARDIVRWLTGERDPKSRTDFAVVPTHDVDQLRSYHAFWRPLRTAVGDIAKRFSPGLAWRRLAASYGTGEPWRSVQHLMALSERKNVQSKFFFMGPSRLSQDSPYAHTMPALLKRLSDHIIEAGHSVGFHPGYASSTDENDWNRQRDGLEKVIGRRVIEGRQHMLRYRADISPGIWDRAGMERDYTPCFPDVIGFRSGTCRGFFPYDLTDRRPHEFMQYDTTITDFGLFGGKYRALTIENALDECAPVIETCKKFGGSLVILCHTGQMAPPVRPFYEQLLEAA